MSRMFTKLCVLSVAVCMLTSVLAGCNGAKSITSGTSSTQETSTSASEDPLAIYAPDSAKTYDIVIKSNQITATDEANNWAIPIINKDMNVTIHSFAVDNKPENLDIKIAAEIGRAHV